MAGYGELKKILKSHGLRITDGRLDVLNFFMSHKKALSFRNLENEFQSHDRVTLYRTLNSFTENGILHKIPDDSGTVTYGLCHQTCSAEGHQHNHIHFKCTDCGSIECLDQLIPSISLPGYKIKEANLILNGVCSECDQN